MLQGSSEKVKRLIELQGRGYQRQIDEAVEELKLLDFTDLNAVITWLVKIQGPSDHFGVIMPYENILKVFHNHGFHPDDKMADFNSEDEENFAHNVIADALGCLQGFSLGDQPKIHAIHQGFLSGVAAWRKKFGHT